MGSSRLAYKHSNASLPLTEKKKSKDMGWRAERPNCLAIQFYDI